MSESKNQRNDAAASPAHSSWIRSITRIALGLVGTAASLIVEEPNYSNLAARLLSTYIEKEVNNQDIYSFSQSIAGLVTLVVGLVVLFRLARRAMRRAIWRLRNRLIAAYLFIAVVPIVLLAATVLLAAPDVTILNPWLQPPR